MTTQPPQVSPTDLPLFAAPPARPQARRLAGQAPTNNGQPSPAAHHLDEPTPPANHTGAQPNPFRPRPEAEPELPLNSTSVDQQAVREIQAAVSELLTDRDGQDARTVIADEVTAYNQRRLHVGTPALNPDAQAQLGQAVFDAVFGLGRLAPLISIPGLQNIEVRGHDQTTWLIFGDRPPVRGPAVCDSPEELIELVARLARSGATERPFDNAHPHVDLTLPDMSRLSASFRFTPYPVLTIRIHRYVDIDLPTLQRMGMLSGSMAAFLTAMVRAGKSLVIAGVPEAGKTTLTRGVLNVLDPLVAIGTIETEDELGLHTLPHRHARVWPAWELIGGGEVINGKAAGSLTVNDLIPPALRANVQVLVVGEVRGHEVIAMLEAMQGTQNSVSTVHAKNGRDAVERLVTCATKYGQVDTTWAYRQVAQLVDAIVHVNLIDERHLGGRQHRFIDEIVLPELSGDGAAGYSVPAIYKPGPDGRGIPDPAHTPPWLDELERYGFDPAWLHDTSWDTSLELIHPIRRRDQ